MAKLNLDDVLDTIVMYEPVARVVLAMAGGALLAHGVISLQKYFGMPEHSKYVVGSVIEVFAGGVSLCGAYALNWRGTRERTRVIRAESEKIRAETQILRVENFENMIRDAYDEQNADSN